MTETTSPLAKTREAAYAVGVSKVFLYRHAKQIPAAYRAGRDLRWDIQALRKWMRGLQKK